MDVQNGFIVGIFNYCDQWCATCPFTSWCRVFAHSAEMEASLDPAFHEITSAPLLPEDVPPPPPRWAQELIEEMNEITAHLPSAEASAAMEPSLAPEHEAIHARAVRYSTAVWSWRHANDVVNNNRLDPREIVAWYPTVIAAKVYRALTGLAAEDDADDREPHDYDGSAKVALLGIDRSLAAWQQLVEQGLATQVEAAPLVEHLLWLRTRLEQVFPSARAFVRPAFDEPEEVAKLRAAEER